MIQPLVQQQFRRSQMLPRDFYPFLRHLLPLLDPRPAAVTRGRQPAPLNHWRPPVIVASEEVSLRVKQATDAGTHSFGSAAGAMRRPVEPSNTSLKGSALYGR